MKITKVLGSTALLTAMFAASLNPVSAIYIEGQEQKTLNPDEVVILAQPAELPQDYGELKFQLVVNGKALSKDQVYVNQEKQIMVAVRAISEELGYQLTWNQETKTTELTKGNQWFQVKIGDNQYNFAKMLINLPTAPELTDSKTYVPLAFIQEVLKANVTISETGTITISEQSMESEKPANPGEQEKLESPEREGTITNIYTNEKGSQIELNGFLYGIRLNISDETEIVDEKGEKLSVSDLSPGMTLQVVHSPIMTMSIPPMTSAEKIMVTKGVESENTWGTTGEITKVNELSDNKIQITVKGEKIATEGYEEIILNLSDDTQILQTKDNQPLSLDQLKQGTKVYAFYGGNVTRSLPPIGTATKIMVEIE